MEIFTNKLHFLIFCGSSVNYENYMFKKEKLLLPILISEVKKKNKWWNNKKAAKYKLKETQLKD